MIHNATQAMAVIGAVLSFTMVGVEGVSLVAGGVLPAAIEGKGEVRGGHEVVAGEVAIVDWTIIKRTDCAGQNSRNWFGAAGFELREPIGATKLPQSDDYRTYEIETKIPEYAPVGPLTLVISGHYECVPGQKIPFELDPVGMVVE